MDASIITLAGVVVTVVVGLFGFAAWVSRTINGAIGGLRTEFKSDFRRLEDKVDVIAKDVVDLKVAVARIEGPPRSPQVASRW